METSISKWGNQIDNRIWNEMRKKNIEESRQKKIEQGIPLYPSDKYQYKNYDDFWNDVSIEVIRVNF